MNEKRIEIIMKILHFHDMQLPITDFLWFSKWMESIICSLSLLFQNDNDESSLERKRCNKNAISVLRWTDKLFAQVSS